MKDSSKLDEGYANYVSDPTPENLSVVVDSLKPTIDYQLASLGSTNDPVMKNKAMVYTARAVKDFDPERSSLPTYVSAQLRRLSRDRRNLLSPVRVPERVQLEAFGLHRSEQEYIDKNGREPTAAELADFSNMSVKKVTDIKNAMMAVPTEAAFGEQMENALPDYLTEATDYVYDESDYIDRKIIELKTGYGGSSKTLKAMDIAQKLKISPSQVSRRSMRISKKINEIKEALES